jgi:hypothetical protein
MSQNCYVTVASAVNSLTLKSSRLPRHRNEDRFIGNFMKSFGKSEAIRESIRHAFQVRENLVRQIHLFITGKPSSSCATSSESCAVIASIPCIIMTWFESCPIAAPSFNLSRPIRRAVKFQSTFLYKAEKSVNNQMLIPIK